MTKRADLSSTRSIAKRLYRSVSTISRELKRTSGNGVYDANLAHAQCHSRRLLPRRLPKLHTDGALFQVVRHQLKLLWSPQQIALKLKVLWPNNSEKSVSHETIYNAIYSRCSATQNAGMDSMRGYRRSITKSGILRGLRVSSKLAAIQLAVIQPSAKFSIGTLLL